jgi:hypothetical protein
MSKKIRDTFMSYYGQQLKTPHTVIFGINYFFIKK